MRTKKTVEERLWSGLFPAGIVYCDRTQERHGDFRKLAFLSYRTLELELEKDCPRDMAEAIKLDAAKIQARRGELFQVSACGQTVRLGG